MLAERVVEWTQQWKEEGLQLGRQEGLQLGQVQEARAMVLEAVAVHFGETPPDIAAIVQGVEDRETLHALWLLSLSPLSRHGTALGALRRVGAPPGSAAAYR